MMGDTVVRKARSLPYPFSIVGSQSNGAVWFARYWLKPDDIARSRQQASD